MHRGKTDEKAHMRGDGIYTRGRLMRRHTLGEMGYTQRED